MLLTRAGVRFAALAIAPIGALAANAWWMADVFGLDAQSALAYADSSPTVAPSGPAADTSTTGGSALAEQWHLRQRRCRSCR